MGITLQPTVFQQGFRQTLSLTPGRIPGLAQSRIPGKNPGLLAQQIKPSRRVQPGSFEYQNYESILETLIARHAQFKQDSPAASILRERIAAIKTLLGRE